MKNLKKDNKGFSLVELLVVIAIMVVLVGVVAPSLLSNIEKARESKDIQALDTIAGNVQAAMTNEKVYDAFLASGSFNLKDAYDGKAFSDDTTDPANVKIKASLEDAMAKSLVFGGASDAINLFESKTAKAGVTAGAKIWVKVDSSTGKVSVFLSTAVDASPVAGKSVDFTVTR